MSKVRAAVFLCVLLLITLPYLIAAQTAAPEYVFGGFFLNPMDGNTYLAKMRQGWEGAWQFRLPYTAEPGEGSYLFIFYLFLGHVARWFNAPLLLIFHLARVGAATVLLLALSRFFSRLFAQESTATLAFCLAALGAGMGWLAALRGWVSTDMWVAEAYPFLAAFSNPHFPLSLALMLGLLSPIAPRSSPAGSQEMNLTKERIQRFIGGIAGSFLLSLLSPFGAIVIILAIGAFLLWRYLTGRTLQTRNALPNETRSEILATGAALAGISLASAPVILYDFCIARVHPALAGWNAQNITPTPPFWDVALSLSPALMFAIWEAWAGRTAGACKLSHRLLILWAGLGCLLIFLPTNLQLRFIIGLFIPVAGLAAAGVERLAQADSRRRRNLVAILFGLTLPTLLFIQLAALYSIQSRSSAVYLTRGEAQAMHWIDSQTARRSLILAAPDTGLLIPAHTGRRVIYGHPFETVQAVIEKEAVESFFRTDPWYTEKRQEFLQQRQVDYVFFGPRERALGTPEILKELRLVYQSDGVEIYAAR